MEANDIADPFGIDDVANGHIIGDTPLDRVPNLQTCVRNLGLAQAPAFVDIALVFDGRDLDGGLVVAAAGLRRQNAGVDPDLFLVRPPEQRLVQDAAIVGCTGRNALEGEDGRHEIDIAGGDTHLDAALEIHPPGEAGVADGPWAHTAMIARLAGALACSPRGIHQVGPCQPKTILGGGPREGEQDVGTPFIVRQVDQLQRERAVDPPLWIRGVDRSSDIGRPVSTGKDHADPLLGL